MIIIIIIIITIIIIIRSDGATESGSYLFASMELASQCQAFIGHFSSGSSLMQYWNMCFNHNGKKGLCPPTYDFNSGLWLDHN